MRTPTRHLRLLVATVLLASGVAAVANAAAVFNVAAGDVAGLIAAVDGANGTPEADTINLAAGTYTLTVPAVIIPSTSAAYGLPVITSDVTIVGAGPGSTTIERAPGSPIFRLLKLVPEHASRIEGVTLSGGKAFFQQTGAAIQVSGSLTVANCVLTGGVGGAIGPVGNATPDSELVVEDSTISGNSSSGAGSAIAKVGGSLVIRNSQITGNFQPAVSLEYGGVGLIEDTTIQGNGSGIVANAYGSYAVILEIVRSTIDGNSGSGIDSYGAWIRISDSTISNNVDYSGGGIYARDADLSIYRSTISGNSALYDGGGIYIAGAATAPGGLTSLLVESSTISGNSAQVSGGGIYLAGGLRAGRTIRLQRSTVTGNVADSDNDGSGDGGGIATPTPVVTLDSTILAGNLDGGGESPDCSGPVASSGHNLIGSSSGCGIVAVTTDKTGAALLGPLAANGGPTATHLPLAGSPALDAADPATCGFPDQRGLARPIDGDGDTVAACDIGATESGAATPAPPPSDSFLCYGAKTSLGTTPLPVVGAVGLADDFESKSFDVKKSDALCTPAGANGVDIADPDTHLQGRDIKESIGQPRHVRQHGIKVWNEVGAFTVDTVKTDRLLVPASKGLVGPLPPPNPSSHDVDRYKCYRAQLSAGSPRLPRGGSALGIALENQFTAGRVLLLTQLSRICTAVDEAGQGRKNPAATLLCFTARSRKPLRDGDVEGVIHNLYASSEFGTEQLDASRSYDVCLPSVRLP